MPTNAAITTFQGVVHPWLCDEMGHMNTRHYVGMFDDAMQHFMRHLGHNAAAARQQKLGWADVRHEIDYVAEVPVGALVHIDCQVEKLGNKSIRYRQTMYLSDSGDVAAENMATSVLFDLQDRKAVPLPTALRTAAIS